ncbi:hypothetical protein RFI_02385 [Reticulomyxa filosa]|uniref:Uncharacterized protein n=1 Tax=Reticulomyxa filosa TaxID=46433 RepID=X6P841_RETFI|nr:hypothetical protein RFI_02385 [Reticulomyxa filosa]|eukprot:ETO34705.1 hypothetical protein RFI_02385 [Reticulomyxa filosa]
MDVDNAPKDFKGVIKKQKLIQQEIYEKYLEKIKLKISNSKLYKIDILIQKQQKKQQMIAINQIQEFNNKVLKGCNELNNKLQKLMEEKQNWIEKEWSELEKKWNEWNLQEKEKVTEIISTANSKASDYIPYFKIADNNGQYITSNRELRIAFKTKPVLFFIHFIQNNDNDEEKYPENEKKENEFNNIVKCKTHEMVSEMINNKQQGIVVVATNINQLSKLNHQLPQYDVPFSMMIKSNQYMKKRLIFGVYSVSSFHSKKIIFDNITIDGCVYAVDCIIDGFGNYHITQQFIFTNPSIFVVISVLISLLVLGLLI